MFPNHTQNSCQNFICMHVIITIMIMNKHTHDITILALSLSIHATLICKHDLIPNLSFPIYQLIQHIIKKFDNYCQPKFFKLDYSPARFYKKV
jgi:hypothetical protein